MPTDPPRRAPLPVLLAYGAPSLSSHFLFTAIGLYLLKYSTDVLLMAPATVGLLFGVSRLWDAATDPLIGHLSDRTHTRWGRRRPWIAAAAVPVALSYAALWAPPQGLAGDALTLWMGAAIVAFYLAITAFSVPYHALGAELSAGYHDRSRVFGAKAFGEHLGIVAAAASLLLLESAADPRAAAASVAAWAGGLMVVGVLWAVAGLREPAAHRGRGGVRPAFASFGDVLRNRRARLLLGVFFLEMLGYNAFVTLLPYVTDYVLETPGATAYYLFAAIATTLLGIPAWIALAPRFGKVRVWSAALAVKALVFAGLGFVGAGDRLLIGVLTVVFGFATGASAVLGPSLKADVVDTDEADTGERKEGTFFSAWGLAMKAGVGLAILASGFALDATGFRPNRPQTAEALLGIRLMVSAFPLACHVLALALLGRVDLDASAHADVRRRIRARRAGLAPTAASALVVLSVSGTGCSVLSKADVGRVLTSGRDGYQLPERVISALEIRPGARVAEIGAGDGYWLPWLSAAVGPAGRVYAVEVDDRAVARLEARVREEELQNVTVVRGRFDDPLLPDGAIDLAMTCLTYHHIGDRPGYFRRLRVDLSGDGRVAHLDDRHDVPIPFRGLQGRGHWSDPAEVRREMLEAGYESTASHDFLPVQSFQVFRPAPGT